jgi:hypothetical protein
MAVMDMVDMATGMDTVVTVITAMGMAIVTGMVITPLAWWSLELWTRHGPGRWWGGRRYDCGIGHCRRWIPYSYVSICR